MRFFRRNAHVDTAASIEAFWRWWASDRDRLAAAIADGALEPWVEVISKHVHAIDRGLAWELSEGTTARHALVVSPEGDPALRRHARDWLAKAPPADATWEYSAARQPGPPLVLQVGGLDVHLAEFRAIVSWDSARERVDLRLWHPALGDAPADARMRVAFLFLDNLLGEEDVERWIGSVEVREAPTGGRTPDELREEIARRAAEATGDQWTLAMIQDGRDEALAVLNLTVKSIDHPDCRYHLNVTVARGLEQLSQSGETEALDAAEDRLVEALVAAGAVHLGHITTRRERRICFMCPDGDRATGTANAWAAEERGFGPRVEIKPDPGWEVQRALGI